MLMAQTPCQVADKPHLGGQSSQEGGREERVSMAPKHWRTRRGSCQWGQHLPRAHWRYPSQSSVSFFLQPLGMTKTIFGQKFWQHFCVRL